MAEVLIVTAAKGTIRPLGPMLIVVCSLMLWGMLETTGRVDDALDVADLGFVPGLVAPKAEIASVDPSVRDKDDPPVMGISEPRLEGADLEFVVGRNELDLVDTDADCCELGAIVAERKVDDVERGIDSETDVEVREDAGVGPSGKFVLAVKPLGVSIEEFSLSSAFVVDNSLNVALGVMTVSDGLLLTFLVDGNVPMRLVDDTDFTTEALSAGSESVKVSALWPSDSVVVLTSTIGCCIMYGDCN